MSILNSLRGIVSGIDTAVDRVGSAVGLKIVDDAQTPNQRAAMRVVRRYTALSFASGFIPLPFVDLGAVSSAQLAMLAEITSLYEEGKVPNKERLRIVISSVLGSVVPQGLAVGVAGSAIKSLPVVGTAAGVLLMPGLASTATFALGKAYIAHFEAGGTLLDLDPAELKAWFEKNLAEAKGAPADTTAEGAVTSETAEPPVGGDSSGTETTTVATEAAPNEPTPEATQDVISVGKGRSSSNLKGPALA